MLLPEKQTNKQTLPKILQRAIYNVHKLHIFHTVQQQRCSLERNTVECLFFARTLLREFREAPWIRQNKTRQI